MTKVIYNNKKEISYVYDDCRNKIKTIWFNGSKTYYEYDDRDNMIKEISPNVNETSWEYLFDDYNRLFAIKKNDKTICHIEYEL